MTPELHKQGLVQALFIIWKMNDKISNIFDEIEAALRAYLEATDSMIMPRTLSPELCMVGDDVLADILDEQTNSFGETSAVVKSGYAQRVYAALVAAVEGEK